MREHIGSTAGLGADQSISSPRQSLLRSRSGQERKKRGDGEHRRPASSVSVSLRRKLPQLLPPPPLQHCQSGHT